MTRGEILIVEDEVTLSRVMAEYLEQWGYAVAGRPATGEAAMSHVEKSPPDLILMDIVLAGKMNGVEAARLIRSQHDIPIVYLTGHPEDELFESAKRTDPHAYLSKPVSPKDLRHTVEMTLYRHRMETRLREAHARLELRVQERTAELVEANQQLQREIADRKRAEVALRQAHEELRHSEERFRAIFEKAGDCISVKDSSLRYTLVNPCLQKLLGLPAESIVGRTDREIFGKEVGEHLESVDARVINGETVEEEHTRPVRGQMFTFLDSRTPLRDRDGRIIGVFGISRDITDRKTALSRPRKTVVNHQSPAMVEVLQLAQLAARRDSTILLTGESGAGKDYLAKHIHEHSKRAGGPFFAINCAAISPELAESELFGHDAGAFTGAVAAKRGLLELAEGGSLLLNEIGELPLHIQAKLLAFLDTRSFTRVGGQRNVSVNARLMAATNRDLKNDIAEGRFRLDLYYRLNVVTIQIPPLREILEDLPVLVEEILSQLIAEQGLGHGPNIDSSVLSRLKAYHWPGNIRELRNVLERALILFGGGTIDLSELIPSIVGEEEWPGTYAIPKGRPLNDIVEDFKTRLVRDAVRICAGNKSQAAKLLGIARGSVIRHMKSTE